mgnify:FL=1
MKKTFFSFLLFLMAFSAFAQEYIITGNVTSQQDGLPIPTVNILVKNSSNGVTTDFDGNYTISKVAKNSTLVFSYIGYKTKEVVITNGNPVNVQLTEDVEALEEVVIIGYGSQKRKEVTGAVSTVSSETIEAL